MFRADSGLFSEDYLSRAADFVKNHELLSGTTLNTRFYGTEGFTISFTRAGFARLKKSFPVFHEYVETVAPDRANAFFINPLIIASGAHVGAHVDRSLRSWTHPEIPPCPIKVSVLYLEVPDDLEGGSLLLYPPLWTLQRRPRIFPKTGLLFEFRGDLRHEVAEVKKASTPRISLVMEQYELPPYLLRSIPDMYVRSSREFSSFMDEALESGESADSEELEPETETETEDVTTAQPQVP